MPHKCLTVGVDVGGTKIAAGLVTAAGKIIKHYRLPTEAGAGKKTVLDNIGKAVAAVWDPAVKGVGIGIAGLVDNERGLYLRGPNFPRSFSHIHLVKELTRAFGVPAAIDNDARCFALGEAVFGAGRGKHVVVGITLGTGIGGGIVIDGRPLRGAHKAAGEVGHMTVAGDSGTRCSCGILGHLEGLSAGPAITRRYRQLTGKNLLPTEIQELAGKGREAAVKTVAECGRYLGLGLASIVQVLDPDIIVIGGGVSRDPDLLKAAKQAFRAAVVFPELRRTPIVLSKLGGDAMILGAASLVR